MPLLPYSARLTPTISRLSSKLRSVKSIALAKFSKDAIAVLNLQSERDLHLLKQHLALLRIVTVALEPSDQRGLSVDALPALRHVPVGKLKMPEGGRPVCSQVHSRRETPDCRTSS